MTIQDDETLQMYLEESLEHLADIENDFLAIEENGANIDEDLVNKVYRAAHSIKGGAGFMGLTNIKDLTHEMENILGKIRGREIVPTPDIINVMLSASDELKELMGDILNSNDVDISNHIQALQAILDANDASSKSTKKKKKKAPAAAKASPKKPKAGASAKQSKTPQKSTEPEQPAPKSGDTLSLPFSDGQLAFTTDTGKVTPYFEQGKCVYLVKIEVSKHIHEEGKTCQGLLEEMQQTGTIICANFPLQAADELGSDWSPDVPVMAFLFASILKPGDINVLFEIDPDQILELRADLQLYRLDGTSADAVDAENPSAASESVEDEIEAQTDPEMDASTDSPETDEPFEDDAVPDDFEDSAVDETDAMIEETESMPDEAPQEVYAIETKVEKNTEKKAAKYEHETSLRVHVSLLDQLMTLAGELVLSRNQLLQSMGSSDKRGSEVAGQRIDLITSELQEAIMLTRMQSIGNVFNKFPRVVRDLARNLGKQVELSLEGKDVELDKTIIEAIGDPLTHLVRNAVDHGIEKPECAQTHREKSPGPHLSEGLS